MLRVNLSRMTAKALHVGLKFDASGMIFSNSYAGSTATIASYLAALLTACKDTHIFVGSRSRCLYVYRVKKLVGKKVAHVEPKFDASGMIFSNSFAGCTTTTVSYFGALLTACKDTHILDSGRSRCLYVYRV